MKLVRYLWWPLVVVVSLGVWWLIALWMEPKPLWTIQPETKVEFTHFHQASDKLVGIRPVDANNQWLVVIDARTGKQVAELNVPVSKTEPGTSQSHDYQPRIVGDQVYRFLASNDAEMQLRSWHFANETQEAIIARWPATFINETGSQLKNVPNLQTSWSSKHPGMVLIYRHLISDELLAPLSWAGQLDLSQLSLPGWRFWNTSICLCEVWQWVEATRTMQKINEYTLPVLYRVRNVPSHFPSYWSADGTHFAQAPGWSKTSPAMILMEAATGKFREVTFYNEKQKRLRLAVADQLIFMQQFQVVPNAEQGRVTNLLTNMPHKDSKLIRTFNEWRPLLDANTLERINWPDAMDHKIVGQDYLKADPSKKGRYFYQSLVWDQSPYYLTNANGSPNANFALLRYEHGELQVEKQWKIDQFSYGDNAVLCGHVFADALNRPEKPNWLMWIVNFPKLSAWYRKHFKEWVNYVGEVDTDTLEVKRKFFHRRIDPAFPLLGSDRLLLRIKMEENSPQGYECWQLPIRSSTVGFWSGAVAALVTFCWFYWQSSRNPRKPPIPLKS